MNGAESKHGMGNTKWREGGEGGRGGGAGFKSILKKSPFKSLFNNKSIFITCFPRFFYSFS